MACSNPNFVRHVLDPDTGQIVSHFKGPGRYLNPLDFGSPESLAYRYCNTDHQFRQMPWIL